MKKKKVIIGLISLFLILVSYFLLMRSGNASAKNMFYNIIVEDSKVQILSVLLLSLVFMFIFSVTNRYWLTVSIFMSLSIFIAIANYQKYHLRNEGILPSDLVMLNSIEKILDMISPWVIILGVIAIVLVFILGFWCLHKIDWKLSVVVRVLGIVMTAVLSVGFYNIQKKGTFFYSVGQVFSNNPRYYDPASAVEVNGPVLNFLNNTHVEIMSKPKGYSKKTMTKLEKKYTKMSTNINKSRNGKKQKVVFILSESFSDPSNIPGMKTNQDSIPYTKDLIKNGVGGDMISDGYGGGTANMEYQALTGLSLGNFSATLPTPYTQLVVHQKNTFSINNLYRRSLALHPFDGSLYLRTEVFKKMGMANYKFNPNKPGNFQWQSVDDGFLMVVD